MSHADILRKRNDTSPITGTLKSNDGVADLSNVSSVRLYVANSTDDPLLVDGEAEIIDAAGGKVRYTPTSADFDESGFFICEWEVEYANGSIQTFPNSDYLTLEIVDDLS